MLLSDVQGGLLMEGFWMGDVFRELGLGKVLHKFVLL